MSIPIRVGIITASDRASRGEREDRSGLLLKTLVEALPAEVVAYRVVPDDRETLKKILVHLVDRFSCDLVLTTGGTGLGPRDYTPEVTKEVIEKEVPGIPEAIRQASLKKTKFAMLSRMAAGIRGKSLIVNLPGSPDAVQDAFEILKHVLGHTLQLLRGKVNDCREAKEEAWKEPSLTFSHSSHSHS